MAFDFHTVLNQVLRKNQLDRISSFMFWFRVPVPAFNRLSDYDAVVYFRLDVNMPEVELDRQEQTYELRLQWYADKSFTVILSDKVMGIARDIDAALQTQGFIADGHTVWSIERTEPITEYLPDGDEVTTDSGFYAIHLKSQIG